MSDTALSEQAMRDSLIGLRFPVEAALEPYADLFLAAGLGGCVGLVCIGLARLFARHKDVSRPPGLPERISALQGLPEDARRVGFVNLLKEIAPDRYAAIRAELYRSDTVIDPEAEVSRHV